MTNELVQYNVSDGIATITLNRPEVANAQNAELLHRLDALWDDAAADSEVKVILLRANGKHFSAGHDLKAGAGSTAKIVQADLYDYESKAYVGYSLKWDANRMFFTADGESGKPGGNETIRVDADGRLRIKTPAALVERVRLARGDRGPDPVRSPRHRVG